MTVVVVQFRWQKSADGSEVAEAIGERDLAGARDAPAVVDARIRYRLGGLVPLPAGP